MAVLSKPLIIYDQGRNRFLPGPARNALASATSIVTIMGRMRSGKSLLASYLLRQQGAFRSANREACTTGADMVVARLEDGGCPVAVVDVEGQGNGGDDYDNRLLKPLVLISQAIIFNTKELTAQPILQQLALLMRCAGMYQSSDDGGGAGKKPAGGTGPQLGHLHIVVRSYSLQGANASDWYNHFFAMDPGPGDLAKARNHIRRQALATFRSVNLHLLPEPASNQTIQKYESLPFKAIDNQAFIEGVNALRAQLNTQLCQPSSTPMVLGRQASPREMVALFDHVLAQDGSSMSDDLPGLRDFLDQQKCDQLVSAALQHLDYLLDTFNSTAFQGRINPFDLAMLQQELLGDYDGSCRDMSDHVCQPARNRLVQEMKARCLAVQAQRKTLRETDQEVERAKRERERAAKQLAEEEARQKEILAKLRHISAIGARRGHYVDQLTLYRYDGTNTTYGPPGGSPMEPMRLQEAEVITRVRGGYNGSYRGSWIVFHTSTGRQLEIRGCGGGHSAQHFSPCHFDCVAGGGELILDLVWSIGDAGSRDGYIVGVVKGRL